MPVLTKKEQKGSGAIPFAARHQIAGCQRQIPTLHINDCNHKKNEGYRLTA